VPGKGWFVILRTSSPKESFFTKDWLIGEIQEAKIGIVLIQIARSRGEETT
jgi:hypothetical protein